MYKIICYMMLFLVSNSAFASESQVTLTRNMSKFVQTFYKDKSSNSFYIQSSIEEGHEVRKGTGGLSFASKNKDYTMKVADWYKSNGEYKIILSPVKGDNLKAKMEFIVRVNQNYKSAPVKLNNRFSIVANFTKGSWSKYLAGQKVVLENTNNNDLKPFQNLHKAIIKALLNKAKSKLDKYYDYKEIKEISSSITFLDIFAKWTIQNNKIEFINPLSSLFGKISVIDSELYEDEDLLF
ncbi:MAG: hypothetical protein HAW60_02310 [Bdellovibrionales bacterium]|nr:hypothetical protein [Bdellovibrionales bacterium]